MVSVVWWWGGSQSPLYCIRSVQATVGVQDAVAELYTMLGGIQSSIQAADAHGEQFISCPCFGVQTEVGKAVKAEGGLESHGSVV